MNEFKIYFCAALDIGLRRVHDYLLDTNKDAQLVKDTIQQVIHAYGGQKRFYFIVIKRLIFFGYNVANFIHEKIFSKLNAIWEIFVMESFLAPLNVNVYMKKTDSPNSRPTVSV